MKDYIRQKEQVLKAIEKALQTGRRVSEKDDDDQLNDERTAWFVTQELRRAGFSITPTPPEKPDDPPPLLRIA